MRIISKQARAGQGRKGQGRTRNGQDREGQDKAKLDKSARTCSEDHFGNTPRGGSPLMKPSRYWAYPDHTWFHPWTQFSDWDASANTQGHHTLSATADWRQLWRPFKQGV